jgi:putative ATP-dependent endonuclease of OLD family
VKQTKGHKPAAYAISKSMGLGRSKSLFTPKRRNQVLDTCASLRETDDPSAESRDFVAPVTHRNHAAGNSLRSLLPQTPPSGTFHSTVGWPTWYFGMEGIPPKMRMTRVVIENYRGLRNLALDLGQITVLVGENNNGKTSVLDAIRACLGRPLSRRGNPFDDHDYLLSTVKSKPGDAGKLKIRLEFTEAAAGDWPPDVVQALGDVIVVQASGLRAIRLEVSSELSTATKDFVFDWDFLDTAGKAIPKGKRPQNIIELQRLVPVHYLSALRDAAREFQSRSTFWAPFLRNPSIPQNVQDDLEKQLAELNDKILNAEPRLAGVITTLAKTQGVVTVGSTDTVSIDALPTHV